MIETKQMNAGAVGDVRMERFFPRLPDDATPRQRLDALQDAIRTFLAEAAAGPEHEITEVRWTTQR